MSKLGEEVLMPYSCKGGLMKSNSYFDLGFFSPAQSIVEALNVKVGGNDYSM